MTQLKGVIIMTQNLECNNAVQITEGEGAGDSSVIGDEYVVADGRAFRWSVLQPGGGVGGHRLSQH